MQPYSAAFSPNALRARAVVYELGLDVEIVEVDVMHGGGRTPEYLALNPTGKVPTLVDGDFALFESRAICAYLAGKRPDAGLMPMEPKAHATVEQWLYWQAIHLGPAMQR